MNHRQKTLKNPVEAVGIGLHSGQPIHLRLKPAPPRTGIVFVRTDLDGASLKADPANIDFQKLQMATTLRQGRLTVQTTEHLLSALHGAGVDNVFVELDGPEVPIMDGSATPFLVLLEEAGLKDQPVPRTYVEITKPFSLTVGDKHLSVEPSADFKISYEIDFDHPLIQKQCKSLTFDVASYENEIAPARTFGFLKDLTQLKSMGLIQGGSLDNAIVLDGERILNDRLRAEDEFVSHKILDLVGDLAISGYRFRGHFHAAKAGHEMHARFLVALLASPEHYRLVTPKLALEEDPARQPMLVAAGA